MSLTAIPKIKGIVSLGLSKRETVALAIYSEIMTSSDAKRLHEIWSCSPQQEMWLRQADAAIAAMEELCPSA